MKMAIACFLKKSRFACVPIPKWSMMKSLAAVEIALSKLMWNQELSQPISTLMEGIMKVVIPQRNISTRIFQVFLGYLNLLIENTVFIKLDSKLNLFS